LFAFIVDQAKSVLVFLGIYYVVVRRFGFLKENEKEFVDKDKLVPISEPLIPQLQSTLLKGLESQMFESVSLTLISAYTLFILYVLTLSDYFNSNPNTIAQIDQFFLWIFFSEIILKTFASNGSYLFDKFNLFDATIVILSVVLSQMGIKAKGLGVLRLIRVVVITIRKITGN
jgi:hypothetical protein